MNVLKFGGTSVGTPERIKNVAKLISESGRNFIVLSAMSGTTNSLVEIANYIYKSNFEGAKELINILRIKYTDVVNELYSDSNSKHTANQIINDVFDSILPLINNNFSDDEEKIILSKGEIISTNLMNIYLSEIGVKSVLISAFDFMHADENSEIDLQLIKNYLNAQFDNNKSAQIFITQGFICLNSKGKVDNLERGGSDYTASLIGAAIKAGEIQIWTDIDGMHNNDPRYVKNTSPVRELNFEEAAELAYFGAKILHPTCILPAKVANVPVRLLNTMQPLAEGTIIHNTSVSGKIKAIAAKDGITAIKIKSGRMLLAYGFLRKVFEIFETYKTPIDMITTSEVGVSVTIDNESAINQIVDELKKFGTVTIDKDMVIICVVGDLEWQNRGFEAKAVNALKDIPVRMISYGGSNFNISFLIDKNDKTRALNALSENLFQNN